MGFPFKSNVESRNAKVFCSFGAKSKSVGEKLNVVWLYGLPDYTSDFRLSTFAFLVRWLIASNPAT